MLPTYLTFSENPSDDLKKSINELQPDKVAILVDENTKSHCLPRLNTDFSVIEIKSGESEKTLKTCEHIWSEMTKMEMTRKSLLINLGGGVIGDMGGFAACTFKRGIRFINIPTTLLSMVDASIGGKVGVDFMGLKNHIGIFSDPAKVIVSSLFLDTLEDRQIRSGFAEILKHALIQDADYWQDVKKIDIQNVSWQPFIRRSVELKGEVVKNDPFENGLRKILNFGHTLGHAIESYFLVTDSPLLHGEAIAIGMVLETELARNREILSGEDADEILQVISGFYELRDIPELDKLTSTLHQDKKNQGMNLNFSLIDKIGHCQWDLTVTKPEIERCLLNYQQFRQTI